MIRRFLVVGFSLVLAASLAAACGDDDGQPGPGMPMDGMDGMGGMMDGGTGFGGQLDVVEGARQVDVTATSFEFDPAEIEAGVGEDLAIAILAEDITHTFTVDELGIDVSVQRGDTEVTGARASDAGTYTFYCAVPGHREAGMEGTLVVG